MTTIELDNRGLSPPEPMVRILTALATLGADDRLQARMDREPMLLYPELERRGFVSTFSPSADGEGYILSITRQVQW